MKKIMGLLVITVLLTVNYKAQQIKLVAADTMICPGSKLTVQFKWDYKPYSYNFRFAYSDQSITFGGQIWNVDSKTFYALPKKLDGVDTVYTIKLDTKNYWQQGYVQFKIQEENKTVNILFNCGTVGFDKISPNEIAPIYFDLFGNRTELKSGEILIEQIGNQRKKVLQSNN